MTDNEQQPSQKRQDIDLQITQGISFHQKGQLDSARDAYRAALRIDRENPDALHLLGVVEYQRGDTKKATMLIEKSLMFRPDYAPALESLAKVYVSQNRYEDGVISARHALSLKPDLYSAMMPLGEAYLALDRAADALEAYQIYHKADPEDATVLHNIAGCLVKLGRIDEGKEYYLRALDFRPDKIEWSYNLAVALNLESRFEEAIEVMQQVLSKFPEYVPALITIGDSLQALGRIEEALEAFEHAIQLDPDHPEAHFNLGLALLTKGDLARGWQEYNWRKKTGAYKSFKPPLGVPIWEGEDISGKSLLLFPEQGMGDCINFIRYATLAHEMGATVTCLCSKPLSRLFETVDGIDEAIPPGGELAIPDYQVAIMELPRIFKTTYENMPLSYGYIKANEGTFERPEGIAIGIVWQGNPTLKNDANRSVPLSLFEPLLDMPDVHFYSLQVGPGEEQIGELGLQDRITNLAPGFQDYADTASVISKLDLVIAVDTSVAHLAGALGAPAWLLLPANADWRWGREGNTTPWYSSMRLFRQPALGEWQDVFIILEQELHRLIDDRNVES